MEENQIKQRAGSEEYENFLEERNDDGEYSRRHQGQFFTTQYYFEMAGF